MSIFVLAVRHLFNLDRAFASLAFDDLFSRNARLSILSIANDQLHEFSMVDRIIEE